jgi:hypothetical protein
VTLFIKYLFEIVNIKKRFTDGGFFVLYNKIHGRLLNRAIYHNKK